MDQQFKALIAKVNAAKENRELENLLLEIDSILDEVGNNIDILHTRASLNLKMQRMADAINDYNSILKVKPEDETARFQVEHLKTILKFNNTDIYANPNTNLDPWLD